MRGRLAAGGSGGAAARCLAFLPLATSAPCSAALAWNFTRSLTQLAAPVPPAARVEGEEQGAKGPLEALADTVKGAVDYVK